MILFSKKHNEFNFSSLCYVKTIIVVLLFIVLSKPVSASAYNLDYLDKVKWVGNDKVTSEVINAECPYGEAKGTFSYIRDPSEYTFYTYISIHETTITEDAHEVSMDFQISSANEQYYFSVDSNGATDFLSNEDELFHVASNFNTYPVTKSGDYIVAVDIADGCDYNLISMYLNINGHRYSILRDLPVPAPIDESTAKNTSTTKRKSEGKITKHKTTKNTDKTSKTSTNKTTKFSNSKIFSTTSGTVSTGTQNTDKTQYNYNHDDVESAAESSEKLSDSTMSKQSKALLMCAGAIGIAGVTIMMTASIKGKCSSKQNNIDSDKQDDNFNF